MPEPVSQSTLMQVLWFADQIIERSKAVALWVIVTMLALQGRPIPPEVALSVLAPVPVVQEQQDDVSAAEAVPVSPGQVAVVPILDDPPPPAGDP